MNPMQSSSNISRSEIQQNDEIPEKNMMRRTAKKIAKEKFLEKGTYPDKPAGVANPNFQGIDNNLKAKIFQPTRGATVVQFLSDDRTKGNTKVLNFCITVQESLGQFGGLTDEESYLEAHKDNTFLNLDKSFIPIKNLHVTALAVGVVDASTEEEFTKKQENSQAYRAVFQLFDQYPFLENKLIALKKPLIIKDDEISQLDRNSLLQKIANEKEPFEFIENYLPEDFAMNITEFIKNENSDKTSKKLSEFLSNGGAIFNAVDLKVTDNGSVVLQLAKNDELVKIKEALVELGGIAKGGLGAMTAITIGYFPKFDKIEDDNRRDLEKTISDLNNQLIEKRLTVVMDHLTLVSFKVNSLRDSHISKVSLNHTVSLKDMKIEYLH